MSDKIQCLTCVFEQSSGVTVDASKTNKEWGKVIGVTEASIRRHRKHADKVSVTTGESEKHYPDGSADYTRFSQVPWGYEDFRAFIRSTGQDPDKCTFTWGWTSNPGGGFWNKLNNVRPVVENPEDEGTLPLSTLYATVSNRTAPERVKSSNRRAAVVCLADWQLGKTGRRGGTVETLERLENTRKALKDLYNEREPSTILLLDLGDGIEGFESGGDPSSPTTYPCRISWTLTPRRCSSSWIRRTATRTLRLARSPRTIPPGVAESRALESLRTTSGCMSTARSLRYPRPRATRLSGTSRMTTMSRFA